MGLGEESRGCSVGVEWETEGFACSGGAMSLCAKRGPGGAGRMDTSFLLVAGEHRWHGGGERAEEEGKIPISVQRERLDNKGRCRAGKIGLGIKRGLQTEKTAWEHGHPHAC